MANGNNVTVVGNVTRDPELRFTATGQAKANFGIAVNRRWQNRQTQEWEEATSFFNVVCWGDMGENVGESIQKGARILVTGRLEQRSWETDNGEKRSIVEISCSSSTVRPRRSSSHAANSRSCVGSSSVRTIRGARCVKTARAITVATIWSSQSTSRNRP